MTSGERPPATERANPRTSDLDTLSTRALVERVFTEDRAVLEAVEAAAPDVAAAIDAAAHALGAGGRLIYVGAGSSGRLGVLDAVELGPTFGLDADRAPALLAGGPDAMFRAREGIEDRPETGAADVAALDVGPDDFVCGITASGRTPYTLGALDAARERGARTAVIACSPVAADVAADVVILLETGPEVLAGSTRMKAGTATKLVLNALSLGAMVRSGKVFGNRMVDVRIGSDKLRRRAVGLVAELGNVDAVRAAALLEASGGNAKTAVVMARCGCDAEAARAALAAAGGFLRDALPDDASTGTATGKLA